MWLVRRERRTQGERWGARVEDREQSGAVSEEAPETRVRYRRFLTIPTRWMDNDVYGHVNNVVYYSYFDTVVNEYLVASGSLDIERSRVIGLVVETRCRFFRAIAFPDTVHAGLRVARLGNSSVRYEIGIFRNEEERAAAQGHFVHVYVDRETRRPAGLPVETRRALEKIRV
jgi:acyl-CoA thioester hydrolase